MSNKIITAESVGRAIVVHYDKLSQFLIAHGPDSVSSGHERINRQVQFLHFLPRNLP